MNTFGRHGRGATGSMAAGVALLCAAAWADSGDAPVADRPMPAGLSLHATILASDNAFEISAAPASFAYRGPVLIFADNFRKEFLRVTRLESGRVEHAIAIRLGDNTNDVRVTGSFGPGAAGGEREWIEIPDPEHADLDALRAALADALVREWRRRLPVSRDATPPQAPPAWLVAGAARHAGGEHRMEDFDLVQQQWKRGRLPPLAELLSAEPPAAMRHPGLQAVLVAWMLDRSDKAFAVLLRRLAEGTPWSAALIAETLQEKKDIAGLAGEWDAWQTAATREIRQVGVTTPAVVSAFRSQLQIYPGDCGLPAADAWRGRTFDECLSWPATGAVKTALQNKAMELRIFAAGRDGALLGVAELYAKVLDAAARREEPDKLRAMLALAETGRAQLEARTATGEVLRDPVPAMVKPSDDGRKTRQPAP